MLKSKIELQDFRVPAKIGCTEAERCEPQELSFDVYVYFDSMKSLESDRLEHTIDYMDLSAWITEDCKKNSVSLLEHLAWIITRSIYAKTPLAEEIHLKIKKRKAMPNIDHTAFGLVTRRNS